MDIETGVTLDRSDFVGFEWIFEMHGTLEKLLDRIASEEPWEPEDEPEQYTGVVS